MKRPDEELCKVQFDAFLGQFFDPSEISWIEVAQEDEPPDYYLVLGSVWFAVEVTTLLENVSVGTASPLPPEIIGRFLRGFVKEVEQVARAEGSLHGKYLVTFSTPIDGFSNVRDAIRAKLLDYIRKTSSMKSSSPEIVFERIVPDHRRQQCGIQKVDGRRDRIDSGGPFWVKWEGEATADLCDLIEGSLTTKASKLTGVAEPKILLLLDRYVFADREMYEICLPKVSSLDSFHTVFVVQSSRRGFVFHSQQSDWLEQRSL